MCMRTLFLSDERGGVGGWLIEGDDYFKYFHQGGGGIIRGRQLIKGQLLFKEMKYMLSVPESHSLLSTSSYTSEANSSNRWWLNCS